MPDRMSLLRKLSPVLLQPSFMNHPDDLCRLIVELSDIRTDHILSIVEANQGNIHREMKLIPCMAVELPFAAVRELLMSRSVKKIWHDAKVHTLLDVAVPTVGASKVQESGWTGKDVTVAVLDTGVFPHPDLTRPENRIVAWTDLINERHRPYDDNGHGTHVAGIIAGNGLASRGRFRGMAPEAKLVGIKALDQKGDGNTSDVIAGIEWCIENQSTYNIKALNLSIGAAAQESFHSDPLCRAVSAAWRSGIVVCTAAGNDGPDSRTIHTPGISPQIITVGNLDDRGTVELEDDQIYSSSSRGPTIDNIVKPDLVAPGTEIMSLRVGGGYQALSGTSMAAPMVTGAVAQILQKWPSYQPNQVKGLLTKGAFSMNLPANEQGAGVLNMENVFNEADSGQNEQPTESKSFINTLFEWIPKAAPLILFYLARSFLGI